MSFRSQFAERTTAPMLDIDVNVPFGFIAATRRSALSTKHCKRTREKRPP